MGLDGVQSAPLDHVALNVFHAPNTYSNVRIVCQDELVRRRWGPLLPRWSCLFCRCCIVFIFGLAFGSILGGSILERENINDFLIRRRRRR